jgi:hypothetical protein
MITILVANLRKNGELIARIEKVQVRQDYYYDYRCILLVGKEMNSIMIVCNKPITDDGICELFSQQGFEVEKVNQYISYIEKQFTCEQ